MRVQSPYRPRCGGPNNFQFTIRVKNPRGVNSAGPREIALRLSQFFGKRKQCIDVDPNICRFDRGKILPDRVDARLPAKPATARDRPETLRCVQLEFCAGTQIDRDNILATGRDLRKFLTLANNCFGNQKPSGELIVVSRCAHCGGEGFAADSNFERLFDRQFVAQILE